MQTAILAKLIDENGINDLYVRIIDGWTTGTYRYVFLDDTVSTVIKIKNK